MRWERLFADLEGQLAAADRQELDAEVAERVRSAWAEIHLADRLRAVVGQEVTLRLTGGERVTGRCVDAAPEWVVVRDGSGQALVPLAAVAAVSGLSRAVAPPAGEVLRRLGLRHALRALARDRSTVRVVTGGGTFTGTVDRVGADHLDLAEHPAGEPRRRTALHGVLSVPLAALRVVHSADAG